MADLYGNTTDLQSVLTAVGQVKSEVDTQTDLIAQIIEALANKTAGSSGGGISTCTVTVTEQDGYDLYVFYTPVDGNYAYSSSKCINNDTATIELVCGTTLGVYYSAGRWSDYVTVGFEDIVNGAGETVSQGAHHSSEANTCFKVPSTAGATATLVASNSE